MVSMLRGLEFLETPWGETGVEKPQFPQVNQGQSEDHSQQCLADVTGSSPLPPMQHFRKEKWSLHPYFTDTRLCGKHASYT